MEAANPLARLNTLDGYRQSFTDAVLWRPFVEQVCRRHDWSCNYIRSGTAGTFPTFIADEKWVVKLFGSLFEGLACWRIEQEAAKLMVNVPAIPVARLLTTGDLEMEPEWKYLVFAYVPSVSTRPFQLR